MTLVHLLGKFFGHLWVGWVTPQPIRARMAVTLSRHACNGVPSPSSLHRVLLFRHACNGRDVRHNTTLRRSVMPATALCARKNLRPAGIQIVTTLPGALSFLGGSLQVSEAI